MKGDYPVTIFPDDFEEATKLDQDLKKDMVWLQPQWDEFDRPRVSCPNMAIRRVGDDFCLYTCPHLKTTWSDEFMMKVGCAFPVIYRENSEPRKTKTHWTKRTMILEPNSEGVES